MSFSFNKRIHVFNLVKYFMQLLYIQLNLANIKETQDKCVSGYCVSNTYQKHELPMGKHTNDSLVVRLEFGYIDILDANDKEFTVTFRTILYVKWEEPRLHQQINSSCEDRSIPLDTSLLDHLWFINLFIYNLKEIQGFKTLTPGENYLGKTK